MEGDKIDQDPTRLVSSSSRAVQNPPPISTPFTAHLRHRPFLPRVLNPHEPVPPLLAFHLDPPFSLSAHHPLKTLPLRMELGENTQLLKLQIQHRINGGRLQQGQPQEAGATGQQQQFNHGQEKDQNRTDSQPQRTGKPMGGKTAQSEIQMYGQQEPPAGLTGEEPPAGCTDGRTDGRTSEKPVASIVDQSQMSSGATVSDNENNNGTCTSGKDMENNLLIQEGGGGISPLKALSHIAHIKRKEDCMDAHSEAMQVSHPSCIDAANEPAGAGLVQEPPSKKKKFKQVQFQLDPLVHQRLMRLLIEQHEGSFQRFVMDTLNANVMHDKPMVIMRKPAFSKWKKTRFDQLKGNETQELALAFRSLAESTPGVEVTADLMNTPWQDLNMLQIQKMLEETKKMLVLNEKVHDCPHADCARRFSTPGNLRDHLNEHSGELPYSCSIDDCPHRFRSKQLLCRHMKKHERAHRCTFEGCNKRFAFRERLIVHQKIHSDERPLSCPWEGCGKTFKWANSLHGHMRTHTGEKPFQCTFAGCGRLFGYKVDLTRHRRTHFGQPARSGH